MLQPKVVVVNQISQAVNYYKKMRGQFIYSPHFSNKAQEIFFNSRYKNIKRIVPKATFEPNKSWRNIENIKIFAWNAFNENKNYGPNLMVKHQNRLFTELNFEIKNSFTNFRKKAEQLLPDNFDNAIIPFDEDVKSRIKYYFHDNNFPSSYFETRNNMYCSDMTSRFSFYLSCGALDVKFLYNEIKSYEKRIGSNKSTYWLVFELLWREYFYWHYQSWKQAYFSQNGINNSYEFSDFTLYTISDLKRLSDNLFWQASLNELESTGFQSNRTRQLFASFWINELGLNWRSGAYLFEEYLIDYDVFSNYGNWMYIAGVGVDSRGGRIFNIQNQLNRYDPEGVYIYNWSQAN